MSYRRPPQCTVSRSLPPASPRPAKLKKYTIFLIIKVKVKEVMGAGEDVLEGERGIPTMVGGEGQAQ